MEDKFTKLSFNCEFHVQSVITLFYMEFAKGFHYDGERHDFWEMVYIDKGEMLCTAGNDRFTLRSGELTFHKPNEFHNLTGNNTSAPNVSIITFECRDRAMDYFDGKIFRLTPEDKKMLSQLFEEGLSCYEMEKPNDPLIQKMHMKASPPFGSSQATKNLLELFLIRLYRKGYTATRNERENFMIDGIDVPLKVKQILEYMNEHITENLTVRNIADHIYQSESQTKKIFSIYSPHGIIRYFNALKIREARRLIRDGQMNMAQISEYLHYDTPQYFSRCFSRFTNMTPSEYKASILEKGRPDP